LARIALGWLHWSEEQLLIADMNSIAVGYEGMRDMLSGLFGKAEATGVIPQRPGRPPGRPPTEVPIITADVKDLPKLTPAAFDKMFADPRRKGKPN
jgi:hypothetical protein